VEVMRFLVKHTSIETTYVHYDFQHSSFYRIVCDIAESVKCNPSPPFPDSQTTPHHIFLVPVNLGVLSLSIKNHTPTHHRAAREPQTGTIRRSYVISGRPAIIAFSSAAAQAEVPDQVAHGRP
jgi:hypothetical protein